MFTLRQYLTTLSDSRSLTRTLGEIDLCRDAQGKPLFSVGNNATVFRIRCQSRVRSLRCYAHPMRHLGAIYGAGYLPQELFLYTSPTTGVWVDVVLGDWIEGTTLQQAVAEAAGALDTERLATLATAFDNLASQLLADDRAHGDLKPENIIVDPAGSLHLIDHDATFLPALAGERSPELGTAAFQHPARTADDFDASLDDYPAALISTALHALTLDPALHDRYGHVDGLVFSPRTIHADPALQEVLALFERHNHAACYRVARLLLLPTLRLPGLAALLTQTSPAYTDAVPELFVENGLWGYRCDNQLVIAPLYDSGFDFTEGLAAVLLGATWHYIDPTGRTRISCPGCESVKPFRNGRAQVVRHGLRAEIDPAGRKL